MALSLFDGTSMENQWQLYRVQLINWGTFDGAVEAYFANDFETAAVTVISGASGTGKSTLQDAYDEIMMRSAQFNAASNVGGRGSGAGFTSGKRTLHTYTRGMLDSVYDEATGTEVARVLRDSSRARWTAIGASFVDGLGNYFTAAKLYYLVPECDHVDGDNTRLVTAPELLDLTALETIAEKKFDKRAIERVFPQATVHAARGDYLEYVYRALDIGDGQRGRSLMELLARIRSGRDFKTVSALFNELVLEVPKTYACADKAIEEFDAHSKVHEHMLRTLEQRRTLDPIVARKESYDSSTALEHLCDEIGTATEACSSLSRWLAARRLDVACTVCEEVDEQIAERREALATQHARVDRASARVKELSAQMEEAGFGQASMLEARIQNAQVISEQRVQRRDGLTRNLALADMKVPARKASFEQAQAKAQAYLDDYESLDQEISERVAALAVSRHEVNRESADVRADLSYYQTHRGNMPRALSEARDRMAEAAGLGAEELPFAGELMELKDAESEWRCAVEVCLHGLVRTVLVDKRYYDHLSESIDSVALAARINFRGVDTSDRTVAQGRAGGVASKMDLDEESPFSPWLSRILADERHDALCVPTAADLRGGDDLRITKAGQTRRRFHGAHGRKASDRNVIGFSNEATIARLAERLAALAQEDSRLEKEHAAAERERKQAEAKRVAYSHLAACAFEDVDTAGAEEAVRALEDELQQFLQGNTRLAELRQERDAAQAKYELQVKKQGSIEDALERLEEERVDLAEEIASLCHAGQDGAASGGAASDGAEQDGAGLGAAALDGVRQDGAASDGAASDGAGPDGAAALGSQDAAGQAADDAEAAGEQTHASPPTQGRDQAHALAQARAHAQHIRAAIPERHIFHIQEIAQAKEASYASARELYKSFDRFARLLEEDNARRRNDAQARSEQDRLAIEHVFETFQSRWYDPNRGQTIEAYDDYAAILAEIQHQGIDEQEELWRMRMLGWIREDLVPLRHSYDLAIQEMQDRIDPINDILAQLPFGADGGRLRISLRNRESQHVAEFRRGLSRFAGNATLENFDVVAFYGDVKVFIDQLRRGESTRDMLLDRRRHVEISAKASWPEELGRADSYYNSLAGKSGGEVQELVAFILGSALLYCLGGDAGQRPAFAPVMLDEGFIKADSEFTARAVSAWKRFGFQLIVATPEDKFQSIAPFAKGCVYITKDARGISRITQADLVEE